MTVRVAWLIALIACGSPSTPASPGIEKSPPIATSSPDASPTDAAPTVVIDQTRDRKPFAVAWRTANAGDGGFASAVAVRADGSVVVAGDVDLSTWSKKRRPRLRPSGIAALDAKGAFIWSRDFGIGTIEAIEASDGGLVACGMLEKTGLVVLALGNDGKSKWRFDAKGLSCSDVAILPDGKVAVTGSFDGDRRFGDLPLHSLGEGDLFLAVLDATGKPQWATSAGSPRTDIGNALVASGGGIYVTGWFGGTAKFRRHTLELARGASKPRAENPSNIFLARFEPNGDETWVTSLGVADSFDRGWTISAVSDGVVIAGGLKEHAFLARYGADGKQRWLREAAGTGRAVLGLPNDDIVLATFEHGAAGITRLARYAGDGELIDRARLGGTPESRYDGHALARNANGRIVLAGMLEGESTFTGELASTKQVVSNASQSLVIEVLDP